MEAHDCIAEEDFNEDSNEILEEDGNGTKLVCLEKNRDMPLVQIIHIVFSILYNHFILTPALKIAKSNSNCSHYKYHYEPSAGFQLNH